MQVHILDFNPFQPHTKDIYNCAGLSICIHILFFYLKTYTDISFRWPSIWDSIYTGSGAFVGGVYSIILSYEYIRRLSKVVTTMDITNITERELYRIERTCVIALCSCASTIFWLALAAILPYSIGYFFIPISIIIDGICLMCSFRFGDSIFEYFFGCCLHYIQDRNLLRRVIIKKIMENNPTTTSVILTTFTLPTDPIIEQPENITMRSTDFIVDQPEKITMKSTDSLGPI
ncbi:hypothetical protein RFI_13221 [Reticulomyxa filosa]|uniref:Uncharacterized protein n=1 Tax=Reticulomyxa filosa TaxID=46433 RepID=X6NCB7_RETFI|nr:hypothetical protein RFI_13221 [Reticulomyxa filosa]|eukprot:ETO23940.1 hypothetical protein RFI_13221 [Reticulomyxa filosa]